MAPFQVSCAQILDYRGQLDMHTSHIDSLVQFEEHISLVHSQGASDWPGDGIEEAHQEQS